MQDLACYLRFMQFFAHVSHQMTFGSSFFSDHEFLGGLYESYEGIYDDVVERCLGIGLPIDLRYVHSNAATMLSRENFVYQDPVSFFRTILRAEQHMCGVAQALLMSSTEGTKQFLGNICDDSEKRQYKLKQRMKETLAVPVQQPGQMGGA